jgi:Predicted membrane protein (DUF2306)
MSATAFAGTEQRRLARVMRVGLILLCLIGAAAALRRIVALASPARNVPGQLAELDAAFATRPILTLVHIVPGLLLVSLVPFQFSRRFRSRHLRAHRWIGRIVIILGLVIGLSAILMSRNPIGGGVEIAAIGFFDALFLFALTKALIHIRRREVALHREWIIRAMSIALGVATVRPIMGVFFATSTLTGLKPQQFFGSAFWIGFSLTYVAGELWIGYTRSSPYVAPLVMRNDS